MTTAEIIEITTSFIADTAGKMLEHIAANLRLALLAGDLYTLTMLSEASPQLVLSPVIANALAKDGYSKRDVQEYLYEHAKVPARDFDHYLALQGSTNRRTSACGCVQMGVLPKHFCESDDPDRRVPVYHSPDELMIIVAGTKERNRFFVTQNNGRQGLAVTKKIGLPANWDKTV